MPRQRSKKPKFQNTLYTEDNLYVMNGMNSESVDLIYTDPPFNSKRLYIAPIGNKSVGFKDIWTWQDVDIAYLERLLQEHRSLAEFIGSIQISHSKPMASYICFMAQRIIEIHRVLKARGTLYLHVDPTASHYLKILCDFVFGKNNFRNEIVWCYTGPSNYVKDFPRKHDIILRYTKSNDFVFNRDKIRIPYKSLHSDAGKEAKIWGETGKLQDKKTRAKYLKRGKLPEDYWTDIPSGGHISPQERVGFLTQKPLKLLYRVIEASSNIGDVVFDPFCGCATSLVAAQQLQRHWIGIDKEETTADMVAQRLGDDSGLFTDFQHTSQIPIRTDIEQVGQKYSKKKIKEILYQTQEGNCKGCENSFDILNLELDHIIPKSKGGQDHLRNYQLLCGNCNRIKGDRPMEFLVAAIKDRKSTLAGIRFK